MNIKKLLLISSALLSFNVFAEDKISNIEAKKQDFGFYIKALGGGAYTNSFDSEMYLGTTDPTTGIKFGNLISNFSSTKSGLAQISLGLWSDLIKGGFEIAYIKPFNNKFDSSTASFQGITIPWALSSQGMTIEYVKEQMKDAKISTTMDFDKMHVLVVKITPNLIKHEDFSIYAIVGAGATYAGGRLETEVKKDGVKLSSKKDSKINLKDGFHATATIGLGFDYKINDNLSVVAQYEFMSTSFSYKYEKPNTESKTDVSESYRSKDLSFDMYNNSLSAGLKFNF